MPAEALLRRQEVSIKTVNALMQRIALPHLKKFKCGQSLRCSRRAHALPAPRHDVRRICLPCAHRPPAPTRPSHPRLYPERILALQNRQCKSIFCKYRLFLPVSFAFFHCVRRTGADVAHARETGRVQARPAPGVTSTAVPVDRKYSTRLAIFFSKILPSASE